MSFGDCVGSTGVAGGVQARHVLGSADGEAGHYPSLFVIRQVDVPCA